MVEEIEAGPAATAGIQPGDLLLKPARFPVDNAARLLELTNKLPTSQPLPLLLRRQDGALFVTISLPKGNRP